MQPAQDATQALIAGLLGDERGAALPFMPQTGAHDRPNAVLARCFHERDGAIEIVAIGQRQILVAARRRSRQQRVQTIHTLQQGVITVDVQWSKTRSGHKCILVYVS